MAWILLGSIAVLFKAVIHEAGAKIRGRGVAASCYLFGTPEQIPSEFVVWAERAIITD